MSDSLSEKIFRLFLEEALKSGTVGPLEKKVIEKLFPLLKIPKERFYFIYQEIQKKFEKDPKGGSFDKQAFSSSLMDLLGKSLPPAQAQKNCQIICGIINPLLSDKKSPPAQTFPDNNKAPTASPPVVLPSLTQDAEVSAQKKPDEKKENPPAPSVSETTPISSTDQTKKELPPDKNPETGKTMPAPGAQEAATPALPGKTNDHAGSKKPDAKPEKKSPPKPASKGPTPSISPSAKPANQEASRSFFWLISPFLPVGRIGRMVFLAGVTMLGISVFIASEIYRTSGIPRCHRGIIENCIEGETVALALLFSLSYLVFLLLVKRCHDFNYPGIWTFIALIVGISSLFFHFDTIIIFMLVPCMVRPGSSETNEYGPP